jgi:hypothetical protein
MTDPSSERVSGGDLLLVPALEKLALACNTQLSSRSPLIKAKSENGTCLGAARLPPGVT